MDNAATTMKSKEEALLNLDGPTDNHNIDSFDSMRSPTGKENIGQWSPEIKEDYDATTRTEGTFRVNNSIDSLNSIDSFLSYNYLNDQNAY